MVENERYIVPAAVLGFAETRYRAVGKRSIVKSRCRDKLVIKPYKAARRRLIKPLLIAENIIGTNTDVLREKSGKS